MASFHAALGSPPRVRVPVIAPLWANRIITYEPAMLGAALMTLLVPLASARLPRWWRWKRQLYDPAISDGKILVGVINPGKAFRAEVEPRLRRAAAREIKQSGRS